jgi:DNA-binding response OmpR family regulator
VSDGHRSRRSLDRAVRAATLVLVADPSPAVRAVICDVVEERGYTVLMASDGEEAWRVWQNERPPLVFIDARLPDVDGIEVCARIRAAEPARTTFMIVLAARDGEDLDLMLDAGADDYLSKPPSEERVRARLTIAERRIALEEQRLAAEAELARSRWQEGIGETTVAVEHEINNPLAALMGYASMLEKSETLTPEDRAHVSVITEQAERIAAVVKRLSKLKNPQSVEYLQGAKMIDLSPPAAEEGIDP